jgi:SAM-dependent methyltransferase
VEKIKLFETFDQPHRLFETYIKQKAINGSSLRILEAGCGQRWHLNLHDIQYIITGVDLDKDALEIRKTKFHDLDEIIVGDLHSVQLKNNEYDVIFNAWVLEHLENPEQVLNSFSKWLKPGGLLLLSFPDRNSVWGFITRITPFWFHVFYKKYILGLQNANKPGRGPYPTFHRECVSGQGIYEFCQNNHFVIKEEYGEEFYLRYGSTFVRTLSRLFVMTIAMLSFGQLTAKYGNLIYILEKKGA